MVLVHHGHVIFPVDDLGAAGLCKGGVVHIHHAAVVAVLLQADAVGLGHFGGAPVHLADVIAQGTHTEHETLGNHRKTVGDLTCENRLDPL